MAQSSTGTEQDYLEDNIATVAYHLGRPGAKMRVDHQIGGLNVSEGEVLKEISRRLSVAQGQIDRGELVAMLHDLASVNLTHDAAERQATRMADALIAKGIAALVSPATLKSEA